MALSSQEAVSDGTLATLAVSLEYFSRTEITVTFDGAVVAEGAGWDWVGVDDKQISFSPDVPNGVVVKLQRITAVTSARHDFSGGAAFTALVLDENFEQIIRVAQEQQEGVYPVTDAFDDIDMHGKTLLHIRDAVALDEPVTLGQIITADAGAVLSALASAVGSALVGFSQGISGTVTRTLQSILRRRLTVEDFGAHSTTEAGFETFDSTTALNAAFNYAAANKRHIHADGIYKFTAALAVPTPGNNWGIIGTGSYITEFVYSGAATNIDLFTVGNGTANPTNVRLEGFRVASDTTMTAGIGVHLRRLCRSQVIDVIPDGQDGNGKLWHGIRFNGLDQVNYDHFQIRAQKDGLQVNGLVGAAPKAGLFLDAYKIAACDVGLRIGGAFGGITTGQGDIGVCGDGVVIDTTLVAEANREVFFTPTCSVDACTRSGIVIDQAIASQLRVNFPSRMWVASHALHGIWIKNANGAKISIDAYLYNIPNGDGVRIDDANAVVFIDAGEFSEIPVGYGINATVATSNLSLLSQRFYNVPNAFNFTLNRAVGTVPWPMRVQTNLAVYWKNYTGTLDGAGAATVAHDGGGDFYRQVNQVAAAYKTAGNAWVPLTVTHVDGANIGLSGGVASRPYNIFVMVNDVPNSGW